MEINLCFLSETLSPVSEGSSAQPAVAVVSLRHFWETQPIQCHLSLSFLGSGEVVAYCFTVYAIWTDSLIRQGGCLLWYCLGLQPLFLAVVYTASFLWRFSNCCKIKSFQGCFLGDAFFLCLFSLFVFFFLSFPSTSANSQWLWHQWVWFSVEQMWWGDNPCLTGIIQEAGRDSTAAFLRCLITLTLSLNSYPGDHVRIATRCPDPYFTTECLDSNPLSCDHMSDVDMHGHLFNCSILTG